MEKREEGYASEGCWIEKGDAMKTTIKINISGTAGAGKSLLMEQLIPFLDKTLGYNVQAEDDSRKIIIEHKKRSTLVVITTNQI